MSLLVWYPLLGNATNQGILDVETSTLGTISYEANGKLGKCAKIGAGTQVANGISFDNNLCGELKTRGTVSVWVKPMGNHVHYEGAILSSGNWNAKRWAFGLSQDNSKVDMFGPGYQRYVNCACPVGEWTHIACVYDDRVGTLYKNGQYVDQYTFTQSLDEKGFESDASNTTIGRETYASGYFGFNGYIQDLRVYNEVLSPREIKLLSQGLTIHYKLSGLNKNLIKNSSVCCVHTSNNSSTYPITRTIETPTYERQYEHIVRNNITLNPNTFSIYGRMSRDNIDESIVAGQEVTASIWVRCSHQIDTAYMTFDQGNASGTWVSIRGDTTTLKPNQWVRLSLKTTIAYSWSELGTSSRTWDISVYGISIPTGEIENFYLDLRDVKVEVGGYLSQWSPHPDDTGYSALWEEDDIEYDVSGNGYNGTKNNITYAANTPRNSGAYVLNGTNSWVKVNSNDWMVQKAPEMTVNFWASSENWTTKYNRMVSCTEGGGWNLEPGASGYLRWPINVYTNAEQTTGGYIYNNSGIKLADLTAGYHMFTLVYTTTAHNIYIDGDLYSTYNYQTYGLRYATGNSRLYLGCESNGINPYQPFFNGMMSDFRLYYTALSEDDIKDLYQVGQSLTSSGKLLANEFVEGG